MKTDDEIAVKLIGHFNSIQPGEYLEFYSPFPGLSEEKVVAQMTSRKDDSWDFDLFYFDVFIGKASAAVSGNELTFTVAQ